MPISLKPSISLCLSKVKKVNVNKVVRYFLFDIKYQFDALYEQQAPSKDKVDSVDTVINPNRIKSSVKETLIANTHHFFFPNNDIFMFFVGC